MKRKLFFNRLSNFLVGVKCPACGSRWNRNISLATEDVSSVMVCRRGHRSVRGVPISPKIWKGGGAA